MITEAIAVKERPILFSGPMVKAILEGRKTQTRRVMKPQCEPVPEECGSGYWWRSRGVQMMLRVGDPLGNGPEIDCPYGRPGERLWVRENWMPDGADVRFGMMKRGEIPWVVRYAASEPELGKMFRWHPSIHMPRAASRITLEITKVRVERIQDISVVDIDAEGCQPPLVPGRDVDIDGNLWPEGVKAVNTAWRARWDAINEKRGFGWEKNPWVWVIEFKRLAVSA